MSNILTNHPLEEGTICPNFTLPSDDGYIFELYLESQNIVVFFYPKDNTPGCILEGQDFTKLSDEFHKNDCVLIGISKDNLDSHCKFKKRFNINVKLLSDVEGKVSNIFGVLKEKSLFGKKYMGIERSTFFLTKNKKVAKIWSPVSVSGHAEEVLRYVTLYNQPKIDDEK